MHNLKPQDIQLLIPKEKVNDFLSILWDDFNKTIGRVGAQHGFGPTENPEIYRYEIYWSSGLSFDAEITFFNHTSKGLINAVLTVIDSKTQKLNDEYQKKIIASIERTIEVINNNQKTEFNRYLMIPLRTNFKLSGNYRLDNSNIFIFSKENDDYLGCYIVFPISFLDENEIRYKGMNIGLDISAALTTLTQNIFWINEESKWKLLSNDAFNELCCKTTFTGILIPDDGLIERIDFFSEDGARLLIDEQQETKEIIEQRDCIINSFLCLPERIDIILKIIMDDYRLQQSCRRFHEALMFRKSIGNTYTPSTLYLAAYELIAYVASIEALLDTKSEKTEINCPNCGEFVYKEEWKISERFLKFVDKYGDSPVFNKVYKELYNDRSTFVHTGISLHNLGAMTMRPNQPFILKGKKCTTDLPTYYHNIHEYTGFILRKNLYGKLFCELPKPALL